MLVIGLVLLAGVKVWTQDRIYRSATSEALVEAYRMRAVEVCGKQSAKMAQAAGSANIWHAASEAEISVGNPGVDVAIWDTQNPLWDQRFRNPHLILTAAGEPNAHCAYDLHAGVVTLSP
jgi:hypothetical protein